MTSKEAIQVLKNHNNRKYELVSKRRYAVSIIEQELEVLEEIRNYFKVFDYGEEFQNRYAIQVGYPYPAGSIYTINKETYDKWNRWLNNDI